MSKGSGLPFMKIAIHQKQFHNFWGVPDIELNPRLQEHTTDIHELFNITDWYNLTSLQFKVPTSSII